MEIKSETLAYPYPLRASELVQQKEFFAEVEPISLTSQERQELSKFGQELFESVDPLKKLTPEIHTIYPDFFLTDSGWRLFQLVYLDPDLKRRAVAQAEAEGISLESKKEKKKFYDSAFENLEAASAGEEDFERYKKEKGIEIEEMKRVSTREKATELLFNLENLVEIPTQIRHRVARVSSDYARDRFLKDFQARNGEAEGMVDPYRVSRVVNVEKLVEKVGGYRNLKKEIKGLVRRLKKDGGRLTEAKFILAQIYLRYLNVLIAGCYDDGRILANQPKLLEREKQALNLIRGIRLESAKKDRFADEQASRTMERIDHFLKGIGMKIGEDGLLETIPENLSEFIEERASLAEISETPDYQKYNAIKVNAEQAKKLAEKALSAYGFDERGWSVYISSTKKTLLVSFREKGKEIKEVIIPKDLKRGLINILSVLAHEIEGHVLRYDNQEQGVSKLTLVKELSTGRESILSEAGATVVEDKTNQAICGMGRLAKPYYSLALLEKQKGGSFKDCFRAFLKAYTKGEGKDWQKILEEDEEWQETWSYVYPRTLRIFRRQTPFDDKSGFLPTSKQLDYLEQELVAQTLFEKGWGKILFAAGIDLYSLYDLARLGIWDWNKIREPQFVVAKEIWPRIKKEIDQGKSLDEVL